MDNLNSAIQLFLKMNKAFIKEYGLYIELFKNGDIRFSNAHESAVVTKEHLLKYFESEE